MTPGTKRRRFPWLGFAFGCALWWCAFVAFGLGHGTFQLFAWFGAPLSLFPPAAFVLPIWWAGLEFALRRGRRDVAVLMLILHGAGRCSRCG